MSIDQRLRNGLHPSGSEPGPDTMAALWRVEQRAARQTRAKRVGVGALLAAVLVVVIGAGATLQHQRTDRVDVVVVQPPEQQLVGSYVVDVPASPTARRKGMVGRWVVSLEADGALEMRPPPTYAGATTGAAWRLQDDQLRTDALVEPGCQADSGYVGTYTWSLTDDELTFTLVEDDCGARRILFTAGGWARVP
ncbi:hypothetical protein SAMN05192575_101635 [Nocardioides alpinus]|uniref:Uncharacterized protein n=1 Tax=Nocardioides alpinus TaxID=748909 RepID=A0A1I0W1K1_9ACTN|nr:hypothetical protein [Nocardioides alpinus]PKH37625.1 hypothetical protein CXG46_19555 [Nocardioides alpinus]SFA82559.1 hypothetical protein SAMN05192575_101635 [Nocardioides alpinus]